jgi:hypothetical protein
MYTIQYIVYSKHQHHKFWRELLGRGYLLAAGSISCQRGGMELLGVSLAAAFSWLAGCASGHAFRAGGGVYFGGQTAACPHVCSSRHFGVRWLGSTCSCEIYTQNLMSLIASLVAHHPLAEDHD